MTWNLVPQWRKSKLVQLMHLDIKGNFAPGLALCTRAIHYRQTPSHLWNIENLCFIYTLLHPLCTQLIREESVHWKKLKEKNGLSKRRKKLKKWCEAKSYNTVIRLRSPRVLYHEILSGCSVSINREKKSSYLISSSHQFIHLISPSKSHFISCNQ